MAKAILFFFLAGMAAATPSHLRRSLGDRSGPYRPTCYIENGFDYQGNDLTNVASTPVDQCCHACAATSGCNAWSWSAYNNGTCWLKTARGPIVVNANVQSALLCDGYHTMCQAAQDVDFVGNDIANVSSKSADGCCDACHAHLGCRAYSWSDFNGGTCWLKSAKGEAKVKPGVQSAEAYPASTYEPTCALAYDTDFVGNDLQSAPSAAPTGCCAICVATKGCHAFAWTKQSGGTCYLKSFTGETIHTAGVVSSTVFPNPEFQCNIEAGFDYLGSDLTSVRSPDSDLCCSICSEYDGCNAFTWSDYNGGTCWLKRDTGTRVRNPRTLSGTTQKRL